MSGKQSGQMRFDEGELILIKNTFKDNEVLLKLMRKVFLPEYDPNAPLGQAIDLWMTLDLGSLSHDEQIIRIHARNQVIMHVEQQLMQLNVLANVKEETEEQKAERQRKNSTQ